MIVRNGEDHLGKCLESVRGLFDEIVIVDTGRTDRTKEIAREFGAKVFAFVWTDDFAAARNEALSHATSDYAF
jgi:glycosyltransferase involved in cell wall biosynthesis